MNTVARPATALPGQLGRGHADVHGGVVLDRTLDGQLRRPLAHERRGRADAVDAGAAARPARGVGEHRDARLDAELRGGGGRGDRDVGELLGGRLGVDRAVAVDQHAVAQAHEEDAGDDGHARAAS